MSWNELVYGLGDLVTLSFELLKAGGNNVNNLFIAAITLVLAAWVFKQIRYNKEAERNGTLK